MILHIFSYQLLELYLHFENHDFRCVTKIISLGAIINRMNSQNYNTQIMIMKNFTLRVFFISLYMNSSSS